jgi:CxxC motif-containing protein (DUF1111 family)
VIGLTALSAEEPAPCCVEATEDFSQPEPFEDRPGGDATSTSASINRDAFSHASGNLDFRREFDFKIGNGIFRKLWVSAPSSTEASDGLGPLYNARACQRCHLKDGRGHPPAPDQSDGEAVSMLLRLSVPPQTDADREALASYVASTIPEPVYGGQLQDFAIQGHVAEGRIEIDYEDVPAILADGETVMLRRPAVSIADLGYGPLHPDTMVSARVANPMIGLGFVEAIADEDILARADPHDADGDGISGRPNRVMDLDRGEVALGRYGWKAGQPSVRQQTATAFSGDIGISTVLFPAGAGDCTQSQAACAEAPDGNTQRLGNVEASDTMFDLVVFYARNLAVPPRRDVGDAQVLAGKELFYASGCTGCHTPKFMTRRDAEQPELAGQLIWPYSDFLLHDMGEGLADNRPEGDADGSEWRTAPLWGIGLTETVSGHTYFLHDGRARNLLEAILWHGGEAQSARDRVAAMSAEQRAALIRFLESL